MAVYQVRSASQASDYVTVTKFIIAYIKEKYPKGCARDAAYAHFKKRGIVGMHKTAWWLRLHARGLPIAVDPDSNIDLEAITSPNNPLGNRH